jgi:hypothetical protein
MKYRRARGLALRYNCTGLPGRTGTRKTGPLQQRPPKKAATTQATARSLGSDPSHRDVRGNRAEWLCV